MFNHRDAEQILCIPLSTTDQLDERIWRSTPNGKFSVKTAYMIAKKLGQQNSNNNVDRGQTSGSNVDEDKWKRIWQIQAPNKLKLFLWRSLHNILPVNKLLAQRRVPVSTECPVCGMTEETTTHVLMTCERACKVWLLSPFRFRPEVLATSQFGELWTSMGSVTNGGNRKENLGLFAFVCWQIWKARNDWVFNKKWIGEQEILGYGINEFHDFVAATSKTREPRQPMAETISRWNPPNQGVVKINSDGAFDGSGKRGGVGLVARDYLGQVKWVTAIPISNTHSAEAVEALGFRWAVTLAKEKGGERFSFEGDAQSIIQMLKGEKAISSSLAVIIRDIIRLSTSFCDFSFSFTPRDSNRVAHVVAKHALSIEQPTTWEGTCPDWVRREALFDIS